MKRSLKKVLSTVFVILVILMVMIILDSSVDLSSEYVEEAVQKRYAQYIEIFEKHREKNAIVDQRRQIATAQQSDSTVSSATISIGLLQ